MVKTRKGSGSTRHDIPAPPSYADLMKRGVPIKSRRQKGEGNMKRRILAFMARNPDVPTSNEFLQARWDLAHPQQINQPAKKMAYGDPKSTRPSPWDGVIDVHTVKEPRGPTGKLTNVDYYTINANGVALAHALGLKVNLTKAKELGIVPENWKPS